MLAGSLAYLILSQGVAFFFDWWIYTAVEAALFLSVGLLFVPIVRGSIRSWILPRVMAPRRTLVVGSGPEARLVQRKIEAHPEYGLELVGFLDGDDPETPSPILGRPDQVAEIVDQYEIDRVLLASSVGSHEATLDLVRAVRRPDVQVSIVPRFFEIFTSHSTLDDIEGMPVVTLPPMRLGRSARVLKRSTDVVASGIALLLLSPRPRADRAPHPARQQGLAALLAAPARPARLDVQDRQVPDDVRRARSSVAARSST